MIYILGDADRVREKVETALFDGNLASLTSFSETLTRAVSSLVREMEAQLDAITVMAGGDDVLFTVANDSGLHLNVLNKLAKSFSETTGCTMSFGLGPTLEAAYLNLRRAKATGGGIVERGRRE